jgi:hypothetical protein
MAHVNTVTVQTAEGSVEVTKTSTHRDYVAATGIQYADGTQAVLSWHLTEAAAAKYRLSAEAARIAAHNAHKAGQEATVIGLVVTNKLTGRDAKDATPEQIAQAVTDAKPAPVPVATDNACRCGCGESTVKGFYRPGHDARHASIVARDIASSAQPFFERVTADSDLGSQALIEKAHRQAEALIAKAAKKASK